MVGRIEFLGRFCVWQQTREISRFRTRKTGALLAYLAYHASQEHRREDLVARFWPEEEEDAARNRFRVALSALRTLVEPWEETNGPVLITDRSSVRFAPSAFVTDVGEFQKALQVGLTAESEIERAHHLAQAAHLYRGPFLIGFDEDWILAERQRLEDAYVGSLRRLVRYWTAAGDYEQALDYARRAVTQDPFNERSQAALIRLYLALGRPVAALTQYRELERLLAHELRSLPSPALRQLGEQIVRQHEYPAVRDLPPSRPDLRHAVVVSPEQASGPPPQQGAVRLSRFSFPPQFTRFFGREEELAQLKEMLRPSSTSIENGSALQAPLVTLIGPGGSGKTRLAIEIVVRLQNDFPNAIWMTSLADLTDVRLLAGAIAEAIGLPRDSGVAPWEPIIAALFGKTALLVLDNFEHLIEGGTQALQDLRGQLPTLTCLITSRQRLHLSGERVFPVLPLPTPLRAGTPERLMEFPCVQLFVDRVQAVKRQFEVTPANAEAVAAVCHRLEGIPLAIELMAAWAQVLTPQQMLSRLDHRFDLLMSPRRDLPPRHRTLEATLSWSYRQLPGDLQRFFAGLSVFRGGWTLEAAQTICEEPNALVCLNQLQERSLILTEEVQSTMRFRMLETLREFAWEQLPRETVLRLRGHHANYFLQLVEELSKQFQGPHASPAMDTLEVEHDNLRAALDWFLQQEGTEAFCLRMGVAMASFWRTRGHVGEGRERYHAILNHTAHVEASPLRARIMSRVGGFAEVLSDYEEAAHFYEKSVQEWRILGDKFGLGRAILGQGVLAWNRGERDIGAARYAEALALAREIEDQPLVVLSLVNLAEIARYYGDYIQARSYLLESLAISQQEQDKRGMAIAQCMLGYVLAYLQDAAGTYQAYDAAQARFTELNEKEGLYRVCAYRGMSAVRLGDREEALSLFREGIQIAVEAGDRKYIAFHLKGFTRIATEQGQWQRAAILLAAQSRLHQKIGFDQPQEDSVQGDNDAEIVQQRLGTQEFQQQWNVGWNLSEAEAVSYALSPSVISCL